MIKHNAALRGEQRNTDATAYHLKHQTQRIVKMPRGMNPSLTPCYVPWIQVRSATPLNIKTVRCDNHEVCSRQEVKNMKYTHLTENER
ncbi:hypothetical protein, partial [Vibrio vulnificus]|uniref:hypothetical protein n=1 Tax=Vibrio vulnificus TaxID=672 RepID=UPI0030FF3880